MWKTSTYTTEEKSGVFVCFIHENDRYVLQSKLLSLLDEDSTLDSCIFGDEKVWMCLRCEDEYRSRAVKCHCGGELVIAD
jgi:hypothetical protein